MYPRGAEIFNRRQLTVVSLEDCALIAHALGLRQILPEWLGANLALSGVSSLTSLSPGSRLVFASGAGLVCEEENLPCIHPGNIVQSYYPAIPKLASRFVRAALGRRGICCVVESPGMIYAGGTVTIAIHPEPKKFPR